MDGFVGDGQEGMEWDRARDVGVGVRKRNSLKVEFVGLICRFDNKNITYNVGSRVK